MTPKPFIKLKRAIQDEPVYWQPLPFKLLTALLLKTDEKSGTTVVSLNQLIEWLNTEYRDIAFAVLKRLKQLREVEYEIKPAITENGRLDNRIFITILNYKTYVENV